MKKSTVLGLLVWVMAASQVSWARVLDNGALLRSLRPCETRQEAAGVPTYASVLAKIDEEGAMDGLRDLGAIIWSRRGDILAASVPVSRLTDLEAIDGLVRVSLSRQTDSNLDRAREYGSIDAVNAGTAQGLVQGYDGAGVVVGLADAGFDPHHPAFEGRVDYLTHIDDIRGVKEQAHTPAEISQWVTDNPDQWHATHVAGILAGSRVGPYCGVAPGARIVAATSPLYDSGILGGMTALADYERSRGLPTVINVSLGNYLGPHDGTGLLNEYLDLLSDEAVIVMSAGNEGNRKNVVPMSLGHGESMGSVIESSVGWDGMELDGMAEYWGLSPDDTDYALQLRVRDVDAGRDVYTSDWVGDGREGVWTLEDDDFTRCYEGRVSVAWETDPANGRRVMSVVFDKLKATEQSQGHNWAKWHLSVHARAGQRPAKVMAYADGCNVHYRAYGDPGCVDGGSRMSVSDMACGRRVVCVGAMNSRNSAPVMGQAGLHNWDFSEGAISSFSGYGTLADGTVLPHVSAPGRYVVSAVSSPWIEAHNGEREMTSDAGGAYWMAECGTSMSSPFVAGVLALWLQADPTLSPEQLRALAIETSDRSGVDMSDPRWGQGGVIDALAGLRRILADSGTGSINSAEPLVWKDAGEWKVQWPGKFKYELWSVTGALVASGEAEDDLRISHPGIGLLKVTPPGGLGRTVKLF